MTNDQGPRTDRIHVVAGVLCNGRGEVLVSRRPPDAHQGGLWEFPGGKLDPGESPSRALRRELEEEIGVCVEAARPLIRVPHDYPDRSLLLDVWRVERWAGEPHGREGQAIAWARPRSLRREDFPAADVPVLNALRLPPIYLVTPAPDEGRASFLKALERSLEAGLSLVQLRAPRLRPEETAALAKDALACCRARGARLLVNGDPGLVGGMGVDGVHLNSRRLLALDARPLDRTHWVAASCHDADELRHAARIGVDFAVLSPVRATPSHPRASPLGWEEFARLAEQAPFPVYALGGMRRGDLQEAQAHGAQGIAGIRSLWGGATAGAGEAGGGGQTARGSEAASLSAPDT